MAKKKPGRLGRGARGIGPKRSITRGRSPRVVFPEGDPNKPGAAPPWLQEPQGVDRVSPEGVPLSSKSAWFLNDTPLRYGDPPGGNSPYEVGQGATYDKFALIETPVFDLRQDLAQPTGLPAVTPYNPEKILAGIYFDVFVAFRGCSIYSSMAVPPIVVLVEFAHPTDWNAVDTTPTGAVDITSDFLSLSLQGTNVLRYQVDGPIRFYKLGIGIYVDENVTLAQLQGSRYAMSVH